MGTNLFTSLGLATLYGKAFADCTQHIVVQAYFTELNKDNNILLTRYYWAIGQ